MADKKYIELEKAKEAIMNYIGEHTVSKFPSAELCKASRMGAEGAMNELDYVPTADVVEVKQGYWKRNERNISKMKEFHDKGIALSMGEKSIFYTCSCCNSWGSLSQKYCSECGAEMRGIKDA